MTDENTPLLDRVRHDFEDALHEEESDASFWTLLTQRPTTLVFILSGLALMAIIGSQGADWFASTDKFASVPTLIPQRFDLIEIGDEAIEARVSASMTMDYGVLGEGPFSRLTTLIAALVGSVQVDIPGSIDVRAQVNGRFQHLANAQIRETLNAEILPGSSNFIESVVIVDDLGRPEVVGHVVRQALANKSVCVQASFRLRVSKWGLDWTFPLKVEREVRIPQQSESLANVDKLHVGSGLPANRAVNVSAIAKISMSKFPFGVGGELPPLNWTINMPGCQNSVIPLSDAQSGEVSLDTDTLIINAWSMLGQLSNDVITPCGADSDEASGIKSPLDSLISGYLAGEETLLHFNIGDEDSILGSILSGVNIPFKLNGKSEDERLVDGVQLRSVRFASHGVVDDGPTSFSGEAVVNVTLPSFLDIDREDVVAAVTEIRGLVTLLDDDKPFGRINFEDWMPTITLATDVGYEIKCYFRNVPFKVLSPSRFARISQDLVLYGEAAITYETVLDAYVATPVGSFLMQRFGIRGQTVLYA